MTAPVCLVRRVVYTPIWERTLQEYRPRLDAAHLAVMEAQAQTALWLGELT